MVIAGLRDFYRASSDVPERPRPVLERDNPPLIGGARRVFGSLKAAMEAAGLPYPPHPCPWNEETILQAIRQMHAEGRDLSLAAVKDRKAGSLLGPAMHRFGSWRNAIEAAGIDYSNIERVREWNRESVLQALRERHDSGRAMGGGAMQKEDIPLWAAAKRYFGSYQNALDAAGISSFQPAEEWTWPIPRLQAELRKLHEQGVDLSSGRIRKTHRELFYAFRSRMGSWRTAVESIGLDYDSVRRARDWSRQVVIERIRELHKQGADLRTGTIQKVEVPLSGAVQRYFGTMRRAMEAAGLLYPGKGSSALGYWTEDLVLNTVREKHAHGDDLRYRVIRERNQPLFFAAKTLFGSYTNAVAVAGIDYWQMSQSQLKMERERRRHEMNSGPASSPCTAE